ncbi:MAG: TetR/AcrR family transcriptional regulator [Anaerolineae bacterium]|nr:TetR/AcrR family transcriptional regulator [Anaerolineae bacterium]
MTIQQQRAEETRSRILQAAEECFAQDGYDKTSVAAICQCAGVSKGAFYHHFTTKHEIFMALLNRWLGGLDEQLISSQSIQATIPETLREMAGLVGGVFQAAENRFPLFLEFWSQSVRDPEVWDITVAPMQHYRDFFTGMIERGIEEGSIEPGDPQTTARVVVSLVMGLLVQGMLDPQGADWEQVAREGIRVLLEGMQQKKQ